MITRIEIDGFKSFHDFAVNLQPFQAFIGPNGAGKSNLFDAIVLLSKLAGDRTLYDAFREVRGEIGELFAVHPNDSQVDRMRFAVEMMIGKEITDSLGNVAEVSYTRLRYELHIQRQSEGGFERLYVTHETLKAITGDDDTWVKKNIPSSHRSNWIVRNRRAPYISTEKGYIYKHQEGRSGKRQATSLDRLGRTVLSTISTAEFPTAFAVRQDMLNWRFLQLDPARLRQPSDIYSPTELLQDGSNLAAVLSRISHDDTYAFNDISLDMANLVPGVLKITVEPIRERSEYVIKAEMKDRVQFSSRVLSDGTLRLLALVTLKNDPLYQGVLCFEEPENGVHPLHLQHSVEVLRALATAFDDESEEQPRQVLINTHSPTLLKHIPDKSWLYVDMKTRRNRRETTMTPMREYLIEAEDYYTLNQVRRFLEQGNYQARA
jgi:predicted ATPase